MPQAAFFPGPCIQGREEEGDQVEGITGQTASLGSCCVQGNPACGFLVPGEPAVFWSTASLHALHLDVCVLRVWPGAPAEQGCQRSKGLSIGLHISSSSPSSTHRQGETTDSSETLLLSASLISSPSTCLRLISFALKCASSFP